PPRGLAPAAPAPAFGAARAWAMAPGGAPARHAYSAVAWTLAGFHVVHVLLGLLFAAFVAARLRRGLVTTARPLEARVAAGLWRYVVGQGLVAWAVLHLFPRLA